MIKKVMININQTARVAVFPVGTKFHLGGAVKKVHTVVDIEATFSLMGEFKKVDYIAVHDFLGQQIKSRHCETAIARGIIDE